MVHCSACPEPDVAFNNGPVTTAKVAQDDLVVMRRDAGLIHGSRDKSGSQFGFGAVLPQGGRNRC